jgi:hypothetical protein
MVGIAALRSVAELDEGHAVEAGLSREKFCAFVERIAAISKPDDATAPLLTTLGRVVETSHWMEGNFEIEITGDDCDSALCAYVDDGAIRERLVPPTTIPVPLRAFVEAIEREPALVAALRVETMDGRMVMSAAKNTAVVRTYEIEDRSLDAHSTMPPPPDFDAKQTTAAARDSVPDS